METVPGVNGMLLNVDVGEGIGNEREILPYVHLANIACGAHAGSPSTMRETVRLCQEFGVQIGAHPGWPDREHFGRRPLPISPPALGKTLREQIGLLQEICRDENAELRHVKLHGALYHQAANDPVAIAVLVDVISCYPDLAIILPPNSLLFQRMKESGRKVLREGFADRRYAKDGGLISRCFPGAILSPPEAAVQAGRLLKGYVEGEGAMLPLRVDTLCVHGDHPEARKVLQEVNLALWGSPRA